MTDAMDLARRAVACPRWWREMERPSERAGVSPRRNSRGVLWRFYSDGVGWLPDLTDPATLGCLLALVREAHGRCTLAAVWCEPSSPGQSEGWAVQDADNRMPIAGLDFESEAEALVVALEAAP